MKIYQDGDNEMVEVPLVMQKRNFDALVAANKVDDYIPVSGIAFEYDEASVHPVVRQMVRSDGDEMKERQRQMGFYGVTVLEA
jgi:hypothetical protein